MSNKGTTIARPPAKGAFMPSGVGKLFSVTDKERRAILKQHGYRLVKGRIERHRGVLEGN